MLVDQTTMSWKDSQEGLELLESLAKPSNLTALSNIIDRLEALDQMSEKLVNSSNQLPQLVSIGVDTVDDLYLTAAQHGIDWEQRFKLILPLLERLTEPKQIAKVEAILDLTDQLPGLISMVIDTVDDEMDKSTSQGFDLAKVAELTSNAGGALMAAASEPKPEIHGIFSLIRKLNDPDRRKALGFLMAFLKNLGKRL
ncbi:MAG: DUF1641 domain-containing protein [Saprospiraceae bacterium]|nr:DUF1641 domain-containing protein [Saprospiraceae bacterium]